MVVPQFPPEIIAEVQAWAEVGRTSLERKEARATFELVNKQWNGLVDHDTNIWILTSSDMTRLTNRLKDGQVHAAMKTKTKSIEIDMNAVGRDKRVPELVEALKVFEGCESVLVHHEWGYAPLAPLWGYEGEPTGPGVDLLAAFLAMNNLRHFDYSGCTSCDGNTASLRESQIRSFARHWPKLETLALARCEVDLDLDVPERRSPDGILTGLINLKTFSAQHGISQDALVGFIYHIPPSVASFSVGVLGLYHDHLAAVATHQLRPRASQLIEFEAHDACEECTYGTGYYDDLVSSLTNVRKLTISPNALSDLVDILRPLRRLEHVVLALRDFDDYARETSDDPIEDGPEFPVKDVASLINSVPQLKRVDVLSDTHAGWSAKARKALERTASRHGVELRWVTSGTTDKWPYMYPPV